jgi:hypothetical protein
LTGQQQYAANGEKHEPKNEMISEITQADLLLLT